MHKGFLPDWFKPYLVVEKYSCSLSTALYDFQCSDKRGMSFGWDIEKDGIIYKTR
jgi:hypothetical protein